MGQLLPQRLGSIAVSDQRTPQRGAGVGKNAVLVTGAAGFGGSHLVRKLLAHGHCVTGLDVVPPLHAGLLRGELEHPEFRYVWKSLQDIQPGDVEGHWVVAHLAAQADTPMAFDSPRYAVMQNIEGTVAMLEAVRHAGGVREGALRRIGE